MKKLILALVGAAALPAAANAAPFINGSFEDGPAPGTFTPLSGGSTAINGWTVTGDSVDYIGTYWNAQDGSRSVDLSGYALGGLSQTFDTVAGQVYSVSFFLGANGDGGPDPKSVDVTATGNATAGYSVPIGGSRPDIAWSPFTYTFTAQGASTTLTFAGTGPSTAYGAALDNVSVTSAVPEPAAWALMILGFGAIGGVLRRRGQGAFAAA